MIGGQLAGMKRKLLITILLMLFVSPGMAETEAVYANEADNVKVSYAHSEGTRCKKLSDGSSADGAGSKSFVAFGAGQSLHIEADEPLQGLYIKWAAVRIPGEWILTVGDSEIVCGKNGFLHEYVELPEGTLSCTLSFPYRKTGIVEIEAYGEGELPKEVQRWTPACEKADFLIFSTHADDEVLFLGGVCVLYGGQEKLKTQVVYMCDFTRNDYGYRYVTREHEKLDGLWEMGIRNYPVNGNFPDVDSRSLETALTQYDYDAVVEFVAENIRRFKPQILVSQDFKGEYGHGAHRLLAKAAAEALENTADPEVYPKSAEKYGTWDVPKAYYHLYDKNKLRLNLRAPLSGFNGATGLDVLKTAYLKHETQQVLAFRVSDVKAKYDCAAFGLYRTLVGPDEGNGTEMRMTDNIVTYEEQIALEAKKKAKIGEIKYLGGIASIDYYVNKAEQQ